MAPDGSAVDLPSPDVGSKKSWIFTAGGVGTDYGHGVALDPKGNVFVTGEYSGFARFGALSMACNGCRGMFVAKLSPGGQVQWAVDATGSKRDLDGRGIAADAQGNAYVVGDFKGAASFGSSTITSKGDLDTFVAKISAAGKPLWAVSLGGTSLEYARGIAVDGKGDVYVTGWFHETATFGSSKLTAQGFSPDAYVAKLSSKGSVLWATAIGGTGSDAGISAAVVSGKPGAYVAGRFTSSSLQAGSSKVTNAGKIDVFLAHLDSAGKVSWIVSGGGPGDDYPRAMASDAAGNLVVDGRMEKPSVVFGDKTLKVSDPSTGFAVAYDTAGKARWVTALPSDTWIDPTAVTGCPGGEVLVAGQFSGKASLGGTVLSSTTKTGDIFVATVDVTGKVTAAVSGGGGDGPEYAFGLACGKNARYTVGYFLGTATFGPHTVTSKGSNDIFVWAR